MLGGTRRAASHAADGDFQLYPSWSRDGSRIAFVSWNDQRLGEIRTVGADGSGMRTVTRCRAIIGARASRPTGQTIVFERGGGGYLPPTAGRRTGRVPRSAAGGAAIRWSATAAIRISAPPATASHVEQSEDQKLKLISVD
jgi:Tol biopolymer transport system component